MNTKNDLLKHVDFTFTTFKYFQIQLRQQGSELTTSKLLIIKFEYERKTLGLEGTMILKFT